MDDSTLVEFIQHFDQIPLSNDDFEFPDLLGAAYEYLIKYFADIGREEGRRVLHARRGGPHDGPPDRAAGRDVGR